MASASAPSKCSIWLPYRPIDRAKMRNPPDASNCRAVDLLRSQVVVSWEAEHEEADASSPAATEKTTKRSRKYSRTTPCRADSAYIILILALLVSFLTSITPRHSYLERDSLSQNSGFFSTAQNRSAHIKFNLWWSSAQISCWWSDNNERKKRKKRRERERKEEERKEGERGKEFKRKIS